MKKTACIAIFACLAASACVAQPAQKVSAWRHTSQAPGGHCSAPRAPDKAAIQQSDDLIEQSLLGHWVNGAWAGSDGKATGHCVNISVTTIDQAAEMATIYFGYSGGDTAEFVKARYADGIIAHTTNNGQKYWISVGRTGHMKIEFRDTDGTFYATLKRSQ